MIHQIGGRVFLSLDIKTNGDSKANLFVVSSFSLSNSQELPSFSLGSSGFPALSALSRLSFSAKITVWKNPKFAWPNTSLWPVAQKRARTRKRGRPNRILHKNCHLLALVLGYYQFAFINRSVSKFETMPKILSLGPSTRQITTTNTNNNNKPDEFEQNRLRSSHLIRI